MKLTSILAALVATASVLSASVSTASVIGFTIGGTYTQGSGITDFSLVSDCPSLFH